MNPNMNTSKALEILNLEANPSQADIKKAYREQVKLWHPDRYSAGSAMKTLAEKNIQHANLAYALLRNRPPVEPRSWRDDSSHNRNWSRSPLRPPFPINLKKSPHRITDGLRRYFPKEAFGHILKWLRHNPRHHFRPWYRYPRSRKPAGNGRENIDFERALQNAIRNHTPFKHFSRSYRRVSYDSETGRDSPVETIWRPKKPAG
jgi:curved DNA-binding protein CbpA